MKLLVGEQFEGGPGKRCVARLLRIPALVPGLVAPDVAVAGPHGEVDDAVVSHLRQDVRVHHLDLDSGGGVRLDRDPQTQELLASGQSYRTSLDRKPPAFMVDEIITAMFAGR